MLDEAPLGQCAINEASEAIRPRKGRLVAAVGKNVVQICTADRPEGTKARRGMGTSTEAVTPS